MEEKMIVVMPDQFGETIDSLQRAIKDAGSDPKMSDIMNMTVLAFLGTICCSNGIRFYHKKSYKLETFEKMKPAMKPARPPISGQSNVTDSKLEPFTDYCNGCGEFVSDCKCKIPTGHKGFM